MVSYHTLPVYMAHLACTLFVAYVEYLLRGGGGGGGHAVCSIFQCLARNVSE